jgi:hypothetical protein
MPIRVSVTRRATAAEIAGGLSTWSKVPDGYLDADVTVEVDLEGLARELGPKAIRSKGNRAREAGGLVLVRAHNLRRGDRQA